MSVTPFDLTEEPKLGVAKYVSNGPINNGDGTYGINFCIRIENNGNVNLDSLEVFDDLNSAFMGCGYQVTGINSAEFAVNTSYNGSTDTMLLVIGQDLKSWDEGEVCINVTFGPCTNLGPFENSARATAISPTGMIIEDVSQEGSNPDPDGNGDATDNNDPTGPITFPENGVIGVAKRTVSVDLNNNGCTTVIYEINVENFGDVSIDSIQIVDDLDLAGFGACGSFTASLTSDDFVVNANFNGTTDSLLLNGLDNIQVGDKGAILLTVNACGCPNGTSIMNSATATGVTPAGADLTDASADGSDPDPNNDGNPNESGTTDITLTEAGSLGIAKRTVSVNLDNAGCTEVIYEFNIENFGNVSIDSIQVEDDLAAAGFTACGSFTVSLTSDDFIVNGGYDGMGNNNLLNGLDELQVNDKGAILLTVNACGCPNGTSIMNSATATGVTPAGADLTDASADGSDPDPNNDGNPNESGTTDITLTEAGSLGIAKRTVSVNLDNAGCTEVIYEFNIENFGNVSIDSIQVEDDLAAAGFTACGSFTVSLTSDDFIVNGGYDGMGNNNLLNGLDELQVNDKGAILLTVNACGCPNGTSIMNSATATGVTPAGADLTDASADGSDPDPNNDGNPNESGTTDITLTEAGSLGIAKRTVSVNLDNAGCTEVIYEFNIENFGNVSIDSIQVEDDLAAAGFTACGSFTVSLTSDDFIVNGGYDGMGNNNLLNGLDELQVNDKGAILLTVNACGCPNGTSIMNSATATGVTPAGADLTDASADGSDPDPNNDGNPNESGTTDITLTEAGSLGIAKRTVSVNLDNAGCTEVIYEFNIENFGNVSIDSIQVEDDLAAAGFTACGSFTVSLTSDDFIVNGGYDGMGNNNLLNGLDELQVNDKGAILLTVNACGCPNGTSIMNSATATGVTPAGADLTDASADGSDPDPNNDGNPNESGTTDITLTEARKPRNCQANSKCKP